MFDDLYSIIMVGFILLCISFPLGVWKLIEVIVWLINHVSISIS